MFNSELLNFRQEQRKSGIWGAKPRCEKTLDSLSIPPYSYRTTVFMESPSATLYLLILGLVFVISALPVDSQPQNEAPQSPPSVTTPPPSSSPPPPLTPPPPPHPSMPPQPSPPPPSQPPTSPPPRPPLSPTPPPPPSKHLSSPPPLGYGERNRRRRSLRPPPPSKSNKLNTGKKIGLLFAGLAGILQIGVVGFLVYKRRQLLKVRNRYETCT
ncbi:proline-rich family protein [Tripterygium wilfordii]|uniref:Proline-rich family protein n=1 Tax=Tripterygium wilfordii TaxID=458696 RepID=A0A7J7DGS7_TRIWF|nr:proline-rich receptor-like protein kinase PERK2 [Tripterygium wilfordii]KAF5745551.1 proline-rich family protein [Tripterygium wilfordii]